MSLRLVEYKAEWPIARQDFGGREDAGKKKGGDTRIQSKQHRHYKVKVTEPHLKNRLKDMG